MVDQIAHRPHHALESASYVGAFDTIRKLFAAESLAQERSYTAGTFSFNSGEGRCPTCGGNGFEHVEMQFLSAMSTCAAPIAMAGVIARSTGMPDSSGEIHRGCSRDDGQRSLRILRRPRRSAARAGALRAVGLGYMKLGQPVPTLSGGEAQRLKLAGHLVQTSSKPHVVPVRRADHRAFTSTTSRRCCTPSAG